MSTIFRSRAVTEDDYYEVDFTTFGISLTKITKNEATSLFLITNWVYLLAGQYLEGSDHNNYVKRMDVVLPTSTQQLEFNLDTNPEYETRIGYDPVVTHECTFVKYTGLSESFNHCSDCGKKQ
jgi:hypothetical protein